MGNDGRSLVAGVPELLLLQLLSRREMYGYELARAIRTTTREALVVGEGVLYPALHSLEQRRLLKARRRAVDGRTRVYYQLTASGRKRLSRLTAEWQRIRSGVEAVLQGAGGG